MAMDNLTCFTSHETGLKGRPDRCHWRWVLILALSPAWADGGFSRRTPIVEAFDKNKDAVVNISSEYVVEVRRNPLFDYWGMDDFPFGPQRRPHRVRHSSLGSGFVLDGRGYIVTNAHVVEGAADIKIILADDKTEYQGRVIALSSDDDLALLKIDADEPLTTVTLGRSDDLMIGETILAIGNPLGYQHTITDGVISAIHRNIEVRQDVSLGDLIQISAPINPGNSGGPLININGELIGINTAIHQAAQGIGFAIPVKRLRDVLPRMLSLDNLRRIDFGVGVGDVMPPPDRPSAPAPPGALVRSVRAESAAHKAGSLVGDVITAVNGAPVVSAIAFSLSMIEHRPGAAIGLDLWRPDAQRSGRGAREKISLVLRQRPKPDGGRLARQLFGIEPGPLTQDLIKKYEIYGRPGDLVVFELAEGSPADIAGMEPGDVIVKLDNNEIESLDQLGLLLENLESGQIARFTTHRTSRRGVFLEVETHQIHIRARIGPAEKKETLKL